MMESITISHRYKPHKIVPQASGGGDEASTSTTTLTRSDEDAATTFATAMKSRLRAHADYLDAMLGIIPVSKYLHRTDEQVEQSGRWNKFHKNKSEAAPKQATKEASKKGKRAKFEDAAKRTSTGEVVSERVRQQKGALAEERAQRAIVVPEAVNRKRKAKDMSNGAEPVDEGNGAAASRDGGKDPAAMTELQERLRLKIEAMRAERKAPVESQDGNAQKRARRETRDKSKKTKGSKAKGAKADKAKSGGLGLGSKPPTSEGLLGPPKAARVESLVPTVAESINYGVIKVDDPGLAAATKKGRKKNLQRLLEKAEANQSKLDKLSDDRAKWGAMVKRAQGEKVLDDPKLIKKSIKRKEASKRKSAKAWADRQSTVAKAKSDKQAKRDSNLKARVDKKNERRLKLKRRAGFEGTKKGFVS